MDLVPYGIHLTLTPATDVRTLGPEMLSIATLTKNSVTIDGKNYAFVDQINAGVFGIIYKAEHAGKTYACKMIRELTDASDFQAFLNEMLIHIILLQTSISEPNGPYVPYIYKVAYEPTHKKAFIISEWMSTTLREDIQSHTEIENDYRLPTLLSQLAHILDFFGKELRFNHRDMHSGNIMIADHTSRVVLIDFGYSCLSWEGLQFIGPSIYNSAKNPCYKEDRDLPFLFMELYHYFDKFMSSHLRGILHADIRVRVHNKSCNMGKLCPEHGLSSLTNRYEFLNRPNVRTVPVRIIQNQFRKFRSQHRVTRKRSLRNKIFGTVRKTRRKTKLPKNKQVRSIPLNKGIVRPLE